MRIEYNGGSLADERFLSNDGLIRTHSGAVWGSPGMPGNVPGGIQPAGCCCCWPGFLLRESQQQLCFPWRPAVATHQLLKLPPGTAGPAAMASRN